MPSKSFEIESLLQRAIAKARKGFKGTEKEFRRKLKPRLAELSLSLTKKVRTSTIEIAKERIARSANQQSRLQKRIISRYRSALPLFDIVLDICLDVGIESYEELRKEFTTNEDVVKLEALIEIYSRACQIANEINILVKNGFADGAHARWRSLHELCVTFLFIYDNDASVSEMYHEFEVIENWNRTKRLKDIKETIGFRKVNEKVFNQLGIERDYLIKKYGPDYAKDYGWTINILPKGNRHFSAMEASVSKRDLRVVYSWASDNIHAGILGNKHRLGVPYNKKMFLVGSSIHGLFDPVQFTSYSLCEICHVLLGMEDSFSNRTRSAMLYDLHKLLIKEFRKVDRMIAKKEKSRRASIPRVSN